MYSPKRLNSFGNTDQMLRRSTLCAPLSAQNQKAVTTSGVSATESKLIIALRKQLTDARGIIEHDHLMKLKLIEGARSLKSQLDEAHSNSGITQQIVRMKISSFT